MSGAYEYFTPNLLTQKALHDIINLFIALILHFVFFMTSCPLKKSLGFTIIELMIVIAIISTLAGIAVPFFASYKDRTIILRAKNDIRLIEKEILSFYFERSRFPNDLNEIGLVGILDPYGNPYQYMPAPVSKKGGVGKMRKDHSLVPVNTDFDLYSMGKDGKSVAPFTAKDSQDDIVRANNGQYIGLVAVY